MAKRLLVALLSTPTALIGCHSSEDLPSDPPTTVTEITSDGFQSPTDAVASLDGKTFYFAAWDMQKQPALFRVSSTPGSAATEVMSDLRMGTPGGVSLTAGGGTAVMPTRDADGNAQLTSVDIATGEVTQLATPDIAEPGGVRSARKAGVFVLVDSGAGKIFSAR